MSTTPEQTQGTPAPEERYDELTGVYGFFRRNQKLLLYTAGLFTLLTFSITGPLTSFFQNLFSSDRDRPKLVVNGEQVSLTSEDYLFGELLSRNDRNVPGGLMLPILRTDGDSYKSEDYAILRRAAITEGIGFSLAEVDKAIEATREAMKLESPAKLARNFGFSSLAEYRQFCGEAMRVGTYMQLQLLALPSSDAAVVSQLLAGREKCTYEVAYFDEKAEIEKRKAATPMTDEDLNKWFEEKDERQKVRLGAFDLPLAQLDFHALLYDEGQFDPSQWQEGPLKDFAISDAQLQSYYDSMKDLLFKLDGGDYQEFDDEAVQAKLTRIVQAERVVNDLLGKIREQHLATMAPLSEAVSKARAEHGVAERDNGIATKERDAIAGDLEKARADLQASPEDEALKQRVTELETKQAEAVEKTTGTAAALLDKQEALDAAEQAEAAAREALDLAAELQKLTEGKAGFVRKTMTEQKDAEALEDLDALGLELGKWPQSTDGTSLANVGDLCQNPARTSKAIALFQVDAVEPQPLKPWEELKPLVEDAYWSETLTTEGREKRQALVDALLEKAKEHMVEFLAEKASGRQARIDTYVTEWETGVTAAIAEAEGMLTNPKLGNKARTAWQRTLDAKKRELEAKDARVTAFTSRVDREIERETSEESKKHYDKVLAAAAEQVGFTHAVLGPYPRDLNQQPRFRDRYDATVVYLWNTQAELEVGEATDVLFDTASRRYVVALCTKVEDLTLADLTRREFQTARGEDLEFARSQLALALWHAFSHEALEDRYQVQRPTGTQKVQAAN